MGKRGAGYGSEDHLRRYLDERRVLLDDAVARAVGAEPISVAWLAFPRTPAGIEREFTGLEFLRESSDAKVLRDWKQFWPTRGRQQTWDAVGQVDEEWLLVEAKSNHPEFVGSATTATAAGGLAQITRSLNRVKRDLNVHRYFSWTASYYQFANRLATLWFLTNHGVPARLVFIYFTGDTFPDGTPCPSSAAEWEALIEARRLTLGLAEHHALAECVHHVLLPALPPSRSLS